MDETFSVDMILFMTHRAAAMRDLQIANDYQMTGEQASITLSAAGRTYLREHYPYKVGCSDALEYVDKLAYIMSTDSRIYPRWN